MSTLGGNKVFAAILVALILSVFSGLVAQYIVNPQMPAHQAFAIAESNETGPHNTQSPTNNVSLDPVEPLLSSANLEHGAEIFKKCVQCHTLDSSGTHKIGPNLWGIVGRLMAQASGYMYSTAMSQKSHETWTYEHLNAFLAQPQSFIRGTKMSFAGLRKVQDRADLIAYLRTMSLNPAP